MRTSLKNFPIGDDGADYWVWKLRFEAELREENEGFKEKNASRGLEAYELGKYAKNREVLGGD